MVSFKYLLGLLSIISSLTSVIAVKPIDSWDDLPACARVCLTFAAGNSAPGGGPCSVLDNKCLCTQGLWQSIFSTCMRLGDPATDADVGCMNEKAETIDGVLDWISSYWCPTVNGTEEPDPSYSSWSFRPATTAFTARTRSSTSAVTISTSVLTSAITSSASPTASSYSVSPTATSSSTSISVISDNSTTSTQDASVTPAATAAAGPSTDDTYTVFVFSSTAVSTIDVTESIPGASGSAASTSTSGCSMVYIKTTVVLSFWVLVYLV